MCPRWFLRRTAYSRGFYRVFVGLPPLARRPTLPDARMWATAEVLLLLQPYVSNWYLQINMSAKQQNREPARQYVSKTTKQCVNTTAKQHNSETAKQRNSKTAKQQNRKTLTSVSQYFSQSVLQSVSTSVSQYFSQSVLNSVSTDVNQSVGLFE